MFKEDCCVQPASVCKMFPSLHLYPGHQQRKLLSWDQCPPVHPACQHANIPSHFPGLAGGWCVPVSLRCSAGCTGSGLVAALLPWAHREVLSGWEGTSSVVDFLVKEKKKKRSELRGVSRGAYTSLSTPIMTSTTATNPLFQPGPGEQAE